jgi:hypothetical protein
MVRNQLRDQGLLWLKKRIRGWIMSINCDCSDIFASENGPDVISIDNPIARKQHYCCECGDKIIKGEKYELVKGCWEGSWLRFKTCMFCVKLREIYCPGGYTYTELAETIQGCLGFWYPDDPDTWPDEPRKPEPWQLR